MSSMVGASRVRQRLRGRQAVQFSFLVVWSRSAEKSEPMQHIVIVPWVAVQ